MLKKFYKQPLKTKIMLIATASFLCVTMMCVTLFVSTARSLQGFEDISAVNKQLGQSIGLLNETNTIVDSIMFSGTYNQRTRYENALLDLKALLNSIDMYYTDYTTYYQFQDIVNMADSYGEKADLAINNLISGNIMLSSQNYTKLQSIKIFLQTEIESLMINLYNGSDALRDSIFGQLTILSFSAPLLMVIIALFIGSMVVYFNYRLISPINQLRNIAMAISKGSYYEKQITFEKDSEFNLLSETMFQMSQRIKDNILDMQNRAFMMQKISQQEIEYLKIKSMYNKLELRRLQEQINPHFLFNTLSTLQHTAFLEGANETCNIANSIAKLLRYNLSESNTIVSLKHEIGNVAHYINIQKHRFRDRILVDMSTPEPLPEISLPSLTLQPFVENCFNHGLENILQGGKISIVVEQHDDYVLINIRDNGCGMSEAELAQYRRLFKKSNSNVDAYRKIGMLNAARRLQNFFGRKDIIQIRSEGGVVIELFLPLPPCK